MTEQALQQNRPEMRQDLHDQAAAAAKKGQKCVRTCTTEQAPPQNRPEMRQDLHVRTGSGAKAYSSLSR